MIKRMSLRPRRGRSLKNRKNKKGIIHYIGGFRSKIKGTEQTVRKKKASRVEVIPAGKEKRDLP